MRPVRIAQFPCGGDDVRNRPFPGVPAHLRDSHYKGAKALGHGAGYLYPHDFPGGFVAQQYLPEGLPSGGRPYYEPTEHGVEARIKARLERLRESPGPHPPPPITRLKGHPGYPGEGEKE